MPRMRRDRRPTPVVNLAAPVLITSAPELPEPIPPTPIYDDPELDDLFHFKPLAAYRLAAFAVDPAFAAKWSSFVKRREHEERSFAALLWQYENGRL